MYKRQLKNFVKSEVNLALFSGDILPREDSEEKTELGKQEWIKVYGVLYGCEELTNEKFDAAVAAAEK